VGNADGTVLRVVAIETGIAILKAALQWQMTGVVKHALGARQGRMPGAAMTLVVVLHGQPWPAWRYRPDGGGLAMRRALYLCAIDIQQEALLVIKGGMARSRATWALGAADGGKEVAPALYGYVEAGFLPARLGDDG